MKEMRSTMRGARTFVGITLFLLFLAGVSLLIYYSIARDAFGPSAATAGRTIFSFLSVTEALMLAVVTPALTAGAIASERQKQTFDMLMATPLSPGQVLRGKLLASMNYLFLLMIAALPINAIVFLFGGIGPSALLWWIALVVVVLLMLGTLGLLMST
ncbi:MAG: ABC transporter permease subunit, partial [Chloroflexota bacterium]|nr:ABC transporter permease subunit [Chloroflexota bacterium]